MGEGAAAKTAEWGWCACLELRKGRDSLGTVFRENDVEFTVGRWAGGDRFFRVAVLGLAGSPKAAQEAQRLAGFPFSS